MKLDRALVGGLVVDPKNGIEAKMDIGIADGKVAVVAPEIDLSDTKAVHDVSGKVVIPGVIDLHVHTSRRHAGYNAHRMMAKAGVVTAFDVGGPLDEYYEFCRTDGAGLNMAALQQIRPGLTVKGEDPKEPEIEHLISESLSEGALGIKMLGGHYPLTPEASRRTLEACNKARCYVAFHGGSTKYGSNIEGLIEAVELCEGLRCHIPHINSYCGGMVKKPLLEILEALDALEKNRNIFSESYLAIINGTSARCIDGVPESKATQLCLTSQGYPATQAGLRQAILDGYGKVNQQYGGENINVTGEAGVRRWESAGTVTSVNFPKNPPVSRMLSAIAKDDDGEFIVDALATDGGGHPRNVAVERGMCLVKLECWTMQEFVRKVSYVPSRILGLTQKGHLGVGADADITVIDHGTGKACMSVSAGNLVLVDGALVARSTRIITTAAGKDYVEKLGFESYVVDIEDGVFYESAPGDLPRPF